MAVSRLYIDVLSDDVPELRDVLFMALSTHPYSMRDRPELLRKVAQVFTEASRILLVPIAERLPCQTDVEAWASFDYSQPQGPQKVTLSATYTNDFLPAQDVK
jgi:hypothetical protein